MREILLNKKIGGDPPTPTGDLAYRLLINTKEMMWDPDLVGFVNEPQVNYWLGPGKHVVNYVLRGGELFNMVLLVPDDIPAGEGSTVEGDVVEMRRLFEGWDLRWVYCFYHYLQKLFRSLGFRSRLCVYNYFNFFFQNKRGVGFLSSMVWLRVCMLLS